MSFRFILLMLFQLVISISSFGQISQKGRIIPYFSSYTSPKSWDSYKSDVYQGGAANFVNVNGKVPVDMTQAAGALVLESTLPSGYWNIIFRVDCASMPDSVSILTVHCQDILHQSRVWYIYD